MTPFRVCWGNSSCIWIERKWGLFSWWVNPISHRRGPSLALDQWLSIVFVGTNPSAFQLHLQIFFLFFIFSVWPTFLSWFNILLLLCPQRIASSCSFFPHWRPFLALILSLALVLQLLYPSSALDYPSALRFLNEWKHESRKIFTLNLGRVLICSYSLQNVQTIFSFETVALQCMTVVFEWWIIIRLQPVSH